ncbi:hypothetical protein Tsubulata_037448 [Turnera subulata]|uniref:Omega-hydroxypalmitate O-feruloyl transferase n=1 Tax=Turnera subulata TaxID=218843 RepID=A0A9Q0GDI3_9ROSI|nr:hypothetical protein Tsubulata_037448 [Turnera subulata]
MDNTICITNRDVVKEDPVKLVSSNNPSPVETVYLSNIDQAVSFNVETIYLFEVAPSKSSSTQDVSDRVKKAVEDTLLVPYYFMAGRLNINEKTKRLELVCDNSGVLFVSASSRLELKDLGNLSLPNPTFHHFIHRPGLYKSLAETALLTIQAMLYYLNIYKSQDLHVEVSQSGLWHTMPYLMAKEPLISSLPSSFTVPGQAFPSPLIFSKTYVHKVFFFSPEKIATLKEKAMAHCSSFEVMVAHTWKARTKAVFANLDAYSTVLFAVDIRSRISPALPDGFAGNAVMTAFATAKVGDLLDLPLSFAVRKIKEANERVTSDYIRSAIDWLEVYKGVPAACNGNFYVSAWWKLPFHELDFGFGKPVHVGPVVFGNDQFVVLLPEGNSVDNEGGIKLWIGLEPEKMDRFMTHILDI